MKCASCETQIPASFGHAIRKNECPACGNILMDEESMAFIEELRGFILSTVKVREETADMLAMALVAAYDMTGREEGQHQPPLSRRTSAKAARKAVAAAKGEEDLEDDGIVRAADLFDPNNPIPKEEQEAIMQERIETRLIQQSMIPSQVASRTQNPGPPLSDSQLAESHVLEEMRLQRLQKQEANRANNPSSQIVISRSQH
jgi:hypothetical protein